MIKSPVAIFNESDDGIKTYYELLEKGEITKKDDNHNPHTIKVVHELSAWYNGVIG